PDDRGVHRRAVRDERAAARGGLQAGVLRAAGPDGDAHRVPAGLLPEAALALISRAAGGRTAAAARRRDRGSPRAPAWGSGRAARSASPSAASRPSDRSEERR